MLNYKKLFVGLAVVAMVFSASALSVSALTQAEASALIAALGLTPSQAQAVMALVSATDTSAGGSMMSRGSFNTNLTVGSRGADVSMLQQVLIDGGYLNIAAPTGYFGPATKAAVIAWQKSAGVSPASGYFGPISRAALNGSMAGGPSTCPPGYNCSPNPGTVPPATCPVGYTCTPTNPGTTPTIPGQGTEGSITTRLAATPAANANVRSQVDVPVYGIEVTAVNSDMTVDRFDLQTSVTPVGGSAQNPGSFVNAIKAWDGSTLLKSWTVSTADWTKDSSDRYHIILTGLGFKTMKGTKRNLTFSFSVNPISTTDVNRTVAVQGYAGNTQNVRATDTVGLQSYSDMSGSANTLSHTFKPAGASTLTVSANTAASPKASNWRVSTTNGISKLIMQAFDVKSESGNSIITKMYVAANATSSAGQPSTIYLCDGSDTTCANPLSSVAASATAGGQSLMSNLSINIPQDTTKTFLLAEDFPTTVLMQQASTSLPVNAVQWQKPDGSTASSSNTGALAGNDQYFDYAVPQFTFVSASAPAITKPTIAGGASSTISQSLTFTVKGAGGTLTKPVIGDFGLCFASSTQTTYTSGSVNCVGTGDTGFSSFVSSVSPSDATVGDGSTYTVTVQALFKAGNTSGTSNIAVTSANYWLVATSARATVGNNRTTQTWNVADWHGAAGLLEHTN